MTHDYKRNGTTSLFAALNVADGTIIGDCMKKHRHQEWIRFLNLIRKSVSAHKEIHISGCPIVLTSATVPCAICRLNLKIQAEHENADAGNQPGKARFWNS